MEADTDGPIEVLLVTADGTEAQQVRDAVAGEGFLVHHVGDSEAAEHYLDREDGIEVVLADMLAGDELSTSPQADQAPLVVIAPASEPQPRFAAWASGAVEYVTQDELIPAVLVRCLRWAMQRRQLEGEVQRLANVDSLTGLGNRRRLSRELAGAVSAARRHGYPLSVCLFDVDGFKQVNDHYGHQAGDAVLAGIARVFGEQLREEDVAIRYGGDEFCVVFPHVDASGAQAAVDRIVGAVEADPIRAPGGARMDIRLTAGIAELSAEYDTGDALLAEADRRLYAAKVPPTAASA